MTGGVLAIDAGTSLIKAVVFDEAGREQVTVKRTTEVLTSDDGSSSQNMTTVLEVVLDCIAEASSISPAPITRVAVTAQGDGAWLVDEQGLPVGDAALWNDARAGDILRDWSERGVLEQAFRINGSFSNLGLPNAILAWIARHDPQTLQRTRSVLTCGSWLYLALTGTLGLHPSEASAPWLDIHTRTSSDELLSLYGLSELGHLVPPVLEPDELTAGLLAEPAARVGLAEGTPVTLAPYDVVATAVGGGASQAGDSFCILGTTLCTGVLLAAPDTSGAATGLTLLNEVDGPVVRAFPTLAGTGVIDWLARMLGLRSAADVTALAAGAPPGAHGARVWPYLSPAGERAPFLDSAARGVIGGLDFGIGREDLARAAVEGLAHVVRDCLDASGARPSVLVLAGGGAASTLWCQAVADVTGVPTARAAGEQVGARGAMQAATGTTHVSAEGEARVFQPEAALRPLFDDRHQDFLRTRDVLADRWRAWSDGCDR